MPGPDNTILNLPAPQSTTAWLNSFDLTKVKDSMMLTALTFLFFGNAVAESVRTQTKTITDLSDKMVEANSLMATLNLALSQTAMTDSVEGYLALPPFATKEAAQDYTRRYIAAGATTDVSESNSVAKNLGFNQTGPNSTWRIYTYRTGATKLNDNLQLSINNYSSLSQQSQLVMQQMNTRLGAAMDYVTAGIEKWGKLLQSFVDNLRR
ncbi:hypothetical protein GHT07_07320 [Caenimonas koreensis DSM 17982]|uniref:Uncharacterized protein n=1 Tax=Caenimonas koreensis DSM 17982 TaxID=1121255 RepID=A0A844B1N8_9BURK|nr:hypothetical protein [Caenimonas koreensis]MRD47083.1 hypothetical protein [Caenimonas koreensis DSM 17982]